jgi:hypothetical protein
VAEGVFIITELRRALNGAGTDGERFEWTSDQSALPGVRGGARACPLRPWTLGGQLRKVRTDYPGAKTPSTQVLGPVQKPQTLMGKWDDRYNFPGYAEQEMRRFETMCRRGNRVRIQFQGQAFEGLIDDWDFPYRRAWDIGYQFTFDVHDRTEHHDISDRSPPTVPSPVQTFDEVDLAVQTALDAHDEAPLATMGYTVGFDVEANLVQLADARLALSLTLDNQELAPTERVVDAFTRLATQFRQVQAAAMTTVADLFEARADVDLTVQTPIGVLDFEVWSRSIRFSCRAAMHASSRGDLAAAERADPHARRVHQAQAGESLYAISQLYYGTPWAWHLIADRNRLTHFVLTGDELLIIPERGQG